MTGSKSRRFVGAIAGISLGLASHLYAQGDLTPAGTPGPTMKSLQEVWDKIGVLENQNQTLQNSVSQQQGQINLLHLQNSLLLDASGVSLPWILTTVDSGGDVGRYTSLAFTPGGHPAISYYDVSNLDLKYAVFNGSSWTVTPVDSEGDVGQFSSLAFTPAGRPAISYYDNTNDDLKYAVFDGSIWVVTTVDSAGSVGSDSSLAFSPAGQPAISYYDGTPNGDLKCALFDGSIWVLRTVDSTDAVGTDSSLAFSPAGQPGISYYDATNTSLKYASSNNGGVNWGPTTVDNTSSVGQATSLAFAPNGQPAISYYDSGDRALKYASFNGSMWTPTVVDNPAGPGPGSGDYSSLAFTPGGQPAISYLDDINRDLRYAIFNGSTWNLTTVDGAGDVGQFTSIAFAPNGLPAISYYDFMGDNLKYAVKVVFMNP